MRTLESKIENHAWSFVSGKKLFLKLRNDIILFSHIETLHMYVIERCLKNFWKRHIKPNFWLFFKIFWPFFGVWTQNLKLMWGLKIPSDFVTKKHFIWNEILKNTLFGWSITKANHCALWYLLYLQISH